MILWSEVVIDLSLQTESACRATLLQVNLGTSPCLDGVMYLTVPGFKRLG